jgi:hypothetical protein
MFARGTADGQCTCCGAHHRSCLIALHLHSTPRLAQSMLQLARAQSAAGDMQGCLDMSDGYSYGIHGLLVEAAS